MKKPISITKTYCQLVNAWIGRRAIHTRQQCAIQQNVPNKKGQIHIASTQRYCTETWSEDSGLGSKQPPISVFADEKINIAKRFRTDNNDVLSLDESHMGLYFKVSKDNYQKFYQYGHPARFNNQVSTFKECGVMVRQPAIEVFDMMKHVDMELPPVRFLLYGRHGSGKSLTLCHVVHKLSAEGFITVHFPDIKNKTRYRHLKSRDFLTSDDGMIQNTGEAVQWLELFKLQNEDRLQEVMTEEQVTFTLREKYDVGTPITDIIEFGLDRPPFSTKCIGIILKELRRAASDKKIKVLVALDGVNVFWKDLAYGEKVDKKVPAQKFSMWHHFMEMLKPTWTNGVVVGTICSDLAACDVPGLIALKMNSSPFSLLGKEGFKFLDPFIPVEVPGYTKEEAINCLDYYIDNHWITLPEGRTRQGKEELMALSARHPLELMNICCYW